MLEGVGRFLFLFFFFLFSPLVERKREREREREREGVPLSDAVETRLIGTAFEWTSLSRIS